MNPTVQVAYIGGMAIIIVGILGVVVAIITARSNRAVRGEVKAAKEEVVAQGKRFDGRVDALIEKVHTEGFNEGMEHQKNIITEEAVRVAGVIIEAEKRAK